jgi:hypothetical protein
MKCGGQILGDAECLGDAFPEVGGETRILVADNFPGESEPSEYVF